MGNYIRWTDEMIDILTEEFPITSDRMVADKLKISVSSVRRKASELKLVKARISNYRTMQTVEELYPTHSQRQIAEIVKVSARTVRRICKTLGLMRDGEENRIMRSEGMKRVFRSENRRILFGLSQKTDRYFGRDKARQKILGELKRHGYLVIRGNRTVYYSSEMRRAAHLESYAEALGMKFEEWESE
ncbi:MAG: hypothetical protein II407_04075 [Prevotella sp.]|nr:hypothetical protein [Prevotella sp.]